MQITSKRQIIGFDSFQYGKSMRKGVKNEKLNFLTYLHKICYEKWKKNSLKQREESAIRKLMSIKAPAMNSNWQLFYRFLTSKDKRFVRVKKKASRTFSPKREKKFL